MLNLSLKAFISGRLPDYLGSGYADKMAVFYVLVYCRTLQALDGCPVAYVGNLANSF